MIFLGSEALSCLATFSKDFAILITFSLSASRSTSIVPLIKLTSAADGGFYAVLSGGFKKDDSGRYIGKMFVDKDGKLVLKEISAAARGETALGLIEV